MARGAAQQQTLLNQNAGTSFANAQNSYGTAEAGYKSLLGSNGPATVAASGEAASAQAQLKDRAAATRNSAGLVSGQDAAVRTGAQQMSQGALADKDAGLKGLSNLYSTSSESADNLYKSATDAMMGRASGWQNATALLTALKPNGGGGGGGGGNG